MPKAHYFFDPVTLSYHKVTKGFVYFFKRAILLFSSAAALGILIAGAILLKFDTPKEMQLLADQDKLQLQLEIMQQQMSDIEKVLNSLEQRDENIYRAVFEAEPIPGSIRRAGFGGTNRYDEIKNLSSGKLITETRKKLDVLSKQIYVQSKSYDEIIQLVKGKEKMLQAIPSIMPVSNKNLNRTASGWGIRIDPIYKIRKFHYGIDFTATRGTDIMVTGNGTVAEAEFSPSYGYYVLVNHGYGYSTMYAHLNSYSVRVGQTVKRGEVIGALGSTGKSTGPHLHYEVHKNGTPVNPINFFFNDLTAAEYEQIVEISSNSGQTFD